MRIWRCQPAMEEEEEAEDNVTPTIRYEARRE